MSIARNTLENMPSESCNWRILERDIVCCFWCCLRIFATCSFIFNRWILCIKLLLQNVGIVSEHNLGVVSRSRHVHQKRHLSPYSKLTFYQEWLLLRICCSWSSKGNRTEQEFAEIVANYQSQTDASSLQTELVLLFKERCFLRTFKHIINRFDQTLTHSHACVYDTDFNYCSRNHFYWDLDETLGCELDCIRYQDRHDLVEFLLTAKKRKFLNFWIDLCVQLNSLGFTSKLVLAPHCRNHPLDVEAALDDLKISWCDFCESLDIKCEVLEALYTLVGDVQAHVKIKCLAFTRILWFCVWLETILFVRSGISFLTCNTLTTGISLLPILHSPTLKLLSL